MTPTEITFNHAKAMTEANRLDSIANELSKKQAQSLETILGEVKKAWQSDSAPAYLQKGEKVKRDMETTANNLRNIASAIRTIANQIRDAEMEAWRLANEDKA